jgi:DNA-binding response OmpR family regulator
VQMTFVSKPVDLTDLLIRIRAMLECRMIEDRAERFARYTEITHEAASKFFSSPSARQQRMTVSD